MERSRGDGVAMSVIVTGSSIGNSSYSGCSSGSCSGWVTDKPAIPFIPH